MSVFASVDAIHFHTQNGIKNATLMTALPFLVVIAAAIYYFAAKAIRKSQGVDVSLVYTTIPPD